MKWGGPRGEERVGGEWERSEAGVRSCSTRLNEEREGSGVGDVDGGDTGGTGGTAGSKVSAGSTTSTTLTTSPGSSTSSTSSSGCSVTGTVTLGGLVAGLDLDEGLGDLGLGGLNDTNLLQGGRSRQWRN